MMSDMASNILFSLAVMLMFSLGVFYLGGFPQNSIGQVVFCQ